MLDENTLMQAVQKLHQEKKKFSQSYDLIVALKDLNLKNPDEHVEFFAQLPHAPGKKVSVCCLVGPEMIDDAKKDADKAIAQTDFERLTKQEIKKVANACDYFIGQANIMPKIAATFGRVLGPRGKMPNPKAGCILPPKAPIKPVVDRLQRTVRVMAKKAPSIQIRVATQQLSPEQVIENIKNIYDQIIHHLPREENNIKAVYLKLTMSEPVRLK